MLAAIRQLASSARRLLSALVVQLLLLQRLLLLQLSALTVQTALRRLQLQHLHSSSFLKQDIHRRNLVGGYFLYI
jgi:hypothetical protein